MAKLSLVGAGHIHTPGFVKRMAEAEDITVVSVWDHTAERAKAHAEALGSRTVDAPEAAIEDADVEGVIICTETDRHRDLVLAAAAAKKHIFAEKPLGMGAADSYEMADAIEKAGVMFQTGYFMRGAPVHLFLKEQLAKGSFGAVTRLRHSNCHAGSLKGFFDTEWRWMADPKIAGCGAYGDLGTHSLDIIMWLLGRPVEVTSTVRAVTKKYGECDETGEGILVFENGVIATLAAGWLDVANPVSVLVSGTEGHAHTDGGKLYFKSGKVEGADGGAPWTGLPEKQRAGFDLFLDVMRGQEGMPLVGAREAARRSAVMEALYRAHETRTWVEPVWQ